MDKLFDRSRDNSTITHFISYNPGVLQVLELDLERESVHMCVQENARVVIRDLYAHSTHSQEVGTRSRSIVLYLEKNAQVTFDYQRFDDQKVLHMSDTKQHSMQEHTTITATLAEHAELDMRMVIAASGKHTIAGTFHLRGANAYVKSSTVYAVRGHEQVDVKIDQHHHAPHTTSNVVLKGVVRDQTQSHYKGTIIVEKDAVHTNAAQKHHSLSLSASAKVTSMPQLEVATNEVHCTHGSASGTLDAEQLWYLSLRGLAPEKSTTMVLRGFFAEECNLVYDDFERHKIIDALVKRVIMNYKE